MSQTETKSPETLAAEAAANDASKAAETAAAVAAKAAEKEASKVAKAAERETAKAAKLAEKQAAKDAKESTKTAAAQAKTAAAAAVKAEKDAKKQPEQNGVRRPSPSGKCGTAWALMDSLSTALNAPVAVGDLLAKSREAGMNDNMVRANYAAWKKFHGLVGRIAKVVPAAPAPAETAAA